MLELFLLVLAVENLADILNNADPFEAARVWFEKLPIIGELARCKYCKIFWISLLFVTLPIPNWIIYTLAIHRLGFFLSEFNERPIHLFVQQSKD